MTANLAKASVNANGNITIGHYVLGEFPFFVYLLFPIGKALGKGTFGQVK